MANKTYRISFVLVCACACACHEKLAGVEAKTSRERELISRLLSDLYGSALPPAHIRTGFSLMLERLEDTVLDVPDAPTLLGNFVARAVVDDILPPAFVRKAGQQQQQSDAARAALARAKALLDDGKQAAARLEAIWGPAATQSTAQLKASIDVMLREFLDNDGDVSEAERCLRDLAVPHFHFELVKRCIYLALELQRTPRARELLATLLCELLRSQVICDRDVQVGFRAAVDNVFELKTDYGPQSVDVLLEFIDAALHNKTIESEFAAACKALVPTRLAEEEERAVIQRETLKKQQSEE